MTYWSLSEQRQILDEHRARQAANHALLAARQAQETQRERTMQFVRTDLSDGAEETLTIVESPTHFYSTWLAAESPFIVQVTQGDHFSGLFTLDGDVISVPPPEWWIPVAIPAEVTQAVEEGWASALYTVERL